MGHSTIIKVQEPGQEIKELIEKDGDWLVFSNGIAINAIYSTQNHSTIFLYKMPKRIDCCEGLKDLFILDDIEAKANPIPKSLLETYPSKTIWEREGGD